MQHLILQVKERELLEMEMPKNDFEVFEYLTSSGKNTINFMAYAVFAHEKKEWIEHFKAQNPKQKPSQGDIDSWISNLTSSQFLSMKGEAERFFTVAATELFREQVEEERSNILRSAIVAEVKAAGSFWKQFAIALLTAILAPLLIGGVIVSALMFDTHAPTIKGVLRLLNGAENVDRNQNPDAPHSVK